MGRLESDKRPLCGWVRNFGWVRRARDCCGGVCGDVHHASRNGNRARKADDLVVSSATCPPRTSIRPARSSTLMEVRMFKWLRASVMLLGAIGLAGFASAAPVEWVGKDANGNTVDSGWAWDTPDPSLVNLVFIKTSNGQFFFQ